MGPVVVRPARLGVLSVLLAGSEALVTGHVAGGQSADLGRPRVAGRGLGTPLSSTGAGAGVPVANAVVFARSAPAEGNVIATDGLPKSVFTWVLIGIGLVFLTCCLGLCCFAMTCGKSYFFAGSAMAEMKASLEARMPETIKANVAGPQLQVLCDRIFEQNDRNQRGFVDFDGRLKRVIVAEYGIEVEQDALFKEMNLAGQYKGKLNREELEEVLKYVEYIRYDRFQQGREAP